MTRFASAIAAVALLATPAAATDRYAEHGSLRRVVQVYYASNDRVQRAVFRDACLHWDMMKENHTARARLKRDRDVRMYDLVADELSAVYETVEPTDGELEQVQKDFCKAADNR